MKWWVWFGVCFPFLSAAQVQDDFSDGDLLSNPAWTGAGDWINNTAGQLQSNNLAANSTFYLSTPQHLSLGTEWALWIRFNANPSSVNYMDIWLMASAPDLSAATTTGYFVRLGNTQDEISLYRKDPDGSITKLIDGQDGVLNSSDNMLWLKVVRSSNGQFRLLRDISGTGFNYVQEGIATDLQYSSSQHFGILVRQSTASFFQKHYADHIRVQAHIPDTSPPSLLEIKAINQQQLALRFSEPVDLFTAEQPGTYQLTGGTAPILAQRQSGDPSLVVLKFSTPFLPGQPYTLQITGIKDLWDNAALPLLGQFSWYEAGRYDVVISEIMSDPTPAAGLPAAEYIELFNRSTHSIRLDGWRLTVNETNSTVLPPFTLAPRAYLLLTSASNLSLFGNNVMALGLSGWPVLPNEGAVLSLRNADGVLIHSVPYQPEWHANSLKEAGGWSLELKDTAKACLHAGNWASSTAAAGGTPGRENSVSGKVLNDEPALERIYTVDSNRIVLVYNQEMDSLSTADPLNYVSAPSLSIQEARPQPPLFKEVMLKLPTAMQEGIVYAVKATGVRNCLQQGMGSPDKARAGQPSPPDSAAVLINEILFNPVPNTEDFIELYHAGKKIIDLSRIFVHNRNSSQPPQPLSQTPLLSFPGDYTVFTVHPDALIKQYFTPQPRQVYALKNLPSFPDDKGSVVLTDAQGKVLDAIDYDENWHHPLIRNAEGVSLERIQFSRPSQDPSNWSSAASTVGFATPAAKNSQTIAETKMNAAMTIYPQVVSPDRDGRDDLVLISCQLPSAGFMGEVSIYNQRGEPVRVLVHPTSLGEKAQWTWDGLNDRKMPVPTGIYLVVLDAFHLDGRKLRLKQLVTAVSR